MKMYRSSKHFKSLGFFSCTLCRLCYESEVCRLRVKLFQKNFYSIYNNSLINNLINFTCLKRKLISRNNLYTRRIFIILFRLHSKIFSLSLSLSLSLYLYLKNLSSQYISIYINSKYINIYNK